MTSINKNEIPKMICEKCNSEMKFFRNGYDCGWICPNCGWGLVTSYFDPIKEDLQLYSIELPAIEKPNAVIIKYLSQAKGCNFIEGKEKITKGLSFENLKAIEAKRIIDFLKENGISYTTTPEFPH